MVDLDGAVKGEKVNSDIFTTVAETTGIRVELGGGIRTMADVEYYLSRGISRVIKMCIRDSSQGLRRTGL